MTDPPPLPPARDTNRPYAVAVVCLGNICRSPTAQVVLASALAEAGLGEDVVVTSLGTGDWHVGQPMDPRAADALRAAGYDPTQHRARQVDRSRLETQDLVLAMDGVNRDDLVAMTSDKDTRGRIVLFRSWDPRGGPAADVPDPYNGGPEGFTEVLDTVRRTADALVAALAARFAAR